MKEQDSRLRRSALSIRGSWIRYVAWGVAVAGLLYLAWIVWRHDAVVEWLRQARPLPFFMTMALLPMFGIPLTPFFVLAGALFGTRLGVVGAIAALGVNLAGCYLLARILRPRLKALLLRRDYKLPNLGATRRGEVRFALAVKLAPGVPGFVKNYVLAIAGIGFPTFFALSMLTSGTYGIAIIVLGDSLFDHERGQILVVAAFLAMLALGVWWWRRRRAAQTIAQT